MTYFDLLARDHAAGSIPEEVFTDISFGELLTKYLGEKAASNIIAVIRRPLSAAGIKLRQELLLELEKAAIVDYMSGLKLMVQDLEIKYNAYHYQENPFYKATAFLALPSNMLLLLKQSVTGIYRKLSAQLCSKTSLPALLPSWSQQHLSSLRLRLKSSKKTCSRSDQCKWIFIRLRVSLVPFPCL